MKGPETTPPGDRAGAAGARRETLLLRDGCETTVHVHPPGGDASGGPVLYVHGIQSHPGWFTASATYLAGRGHAVFQLTRRGSGENRRDRGHARSAGQLLGDLDEAWDWIAGRTGCPQVHLLGVSWGGKLATAWACRRQDRLKIPSLTLVAPGLVPRVDIPARTKLAVAASLLVRPRKRFDIPLSDVELFTDNEAKRRYLRDDPLRLHRATARFLYAGRQLDRLLRRVPRGGLRVPTTLILASGDRIIDNDATQRQIERLTDGRAEITTLDGAHTLEFEPDPGPLFDALAQSLSPGPRAAGSLHAD